MTDPSLPMDEICATLWVSSATLYRYMDPKGEVRRPVKLTGGRPKANPPEASDLKPLPGGGEVPVGRSPLYTRSRVIRRQYLK